MTRRQLLFIDGRWVDGDGERTIVDRWNRSELARVAIARPEDAVAAVDAAQRARTAGLSLPERHDVLMRVAAIVREKPDVFAEDITAETGKPITAARSEVSRAIETLTWAAEEAKRLPGETVRIDAVPSGAGTMAFTIPEPRGVVAAITPFNFPLNLVLHKVAPAIAAGCPVLLKPSDKAVLVAGRLVAAFERAGLPSGWLNLLTGTPDDVVEPWLNDPRVAVITFTGSSAVGWDLKRRSPGKLHILELGSNTAMVVAADADLERAVADATTAALGNSGQACVSLQRIYVERPVAGEFVERLAAAFRAAPTGDPADPSTIVGPMITEEATSRLASAVAEARGAGATVVTGGRVADGVLQPTLLTDVSPQNPLVCQEAFGPVATVVVVDDLAEAIAGVNSSDYALNTSVYTAGLGAAMDYARQAEAGSVLVNMPPSFRADHMPYGGVKGSGQGTEGVRYAIDELLHHKLVVLKA